MKEFYYQLLFLTLGVGLGAYNPGVTKLPLPVLIIVAVLIVTVCAYKILWDSNQRTMEKNVLLLVGFIVSISIIVGLCLGYTKTLYTIPNYNLFPLYVQTVLLIPMYTVPLALLSIGYGAWKRWLNAN